MYAVKPFFQVQQKLSTRVITEEYNKRYPNILRSIGKFT